MERASHRIRLHLIDSGFLWWSLFSSRARWVGSDGPLARIWSNFGSVLRFSTPWSTSDKQLRLSRKPHLRKQGSGSWSADRILIPRAISYVVDAHSNYAPEAFGTIKWEFIILKPNRRANLFCHQCTEEYIREAPLCSFYFLHKNHYPAAVLIVNW